MSWSDWPSVVMLVAWQGSILYALLRHRRMPDPKSWRQLFLLPVSTCFYRSLLHKADCPWAPYVLVSIWGVLIWPTLQRQIGYEPETTAERSERTP